MFGNKSFENQTVVYPDHLKMLAITCNSGIHLEEHGTFRGPHVPIVVFIPILSLHDIPSQDLGPHGYWEMKWCWNEALTCSCSPHELFNI